MYNTIRFILFIVLIIINYLGYSQYTITTIAGKYLESGFFGDGGLAISALLSGPKGIAKDKFGNIYICDMANQRIRKIDNLGVIKTIAGDGISGFSGDGGPALSARFFGLTDIAVDKSGNIYVVDNSTRIRKIDSLGIITTIAGNGMTGFSGDGGPSTLATLNMPNGIAIDTLGNIYVADYYNYRIRKINK